MKYFANTYLLVFGILFIYLFLNIPIYLQAYTWKIQLIRMQLVELTAWLHATSYLFLFLFVKRFFIWMDPKVVKVYLIWLIYTLLANFALIRFSYNPSYYFYLLFTLMPYYFLFLLTMGGFKELNKEKLKTFFDGAITLLGKLYIPVFAFALLQFVFRENFLNLNTEEKTIQVTSELLGLFRPRSIFNSSFEFGLFGILIFSLFSARIKIADKTNTNKLNWLIMILSALGIILSFTRNIYLIWGMAIINLLLLQRKSLTTGFLKVLPHIFMIGSTLLLVVLSLQALSGFMLTDFLSSESTYVRFTLLYALIEGLVFNGNIWDLLFGWGLIQHAGDTSLISIFPDIYNSEDGTLGIDNLYFALFLYQGIIGLGIYLILYQMVWNRVISVYKTYRSDFALGASIIFGTFLGAGVFNLIHYGIFGYFAWFFAFSVLAIFPSTKLSEPILEENKTQ